MTRAAEQQQPLAPIRIDAKRATRRNSDVRMRCMRILRSGQSANNGNSRMAAGRLRL